MKSLKFYKILSITLVVINLATLAFFYFNRPPAPPKPGEPRLADEIGLTGEAKKKSDKLEIQHHKDKKALLKKNFELQKKLYSNIENDEEAGELLIDIYANRTEIDRMTFEFFHEISEMCNDEQQKNLEEMIHRGLRRISGLPPKRRH